ncbi:MAG: hypothetical protein FWC11_04200 [Firmicutes bacterium]|nr:hypothetical protein [Bacillota bacterium]MCL2256044.1 hypothetical protein [Bacillota bacterium]
MAHSILALLNALESELTDKRGLFSKKVDLEKCVEIVYEMKKVFPESIREAEYIIANRDKMLQNADSVAKNIIKESEDRAEHIIDNSELIKRAEAEAKKIVDAGYVQSEQLVDKTKAHLDEMFKDIERYLTSNLTMVRNNREELRGTMIMKRDGSIDF